MKTLRLAALLLLPLCACAGEPAGTPYARSLLGRDLVAPLPAPERAARLEADLARARADLEASPRSEMAIIWHGRRLAYLSRFDEAVAAFTRGLELHPESYRLLRHRGHRYISLRKLDLAIADLERASRLAPTTPLETEPDGIPNARNTPISTTQGNIWYHLGLAHYLKGDFTRALAAHDRRHETTDRNVDNLVSTAYWRHLILKRLGRDREADAALTAVTAELDVIENGGYRDLGLLFKGARSPADLMPEADAVHDAGVANATVAYGVSMHHFLQGDHRRAAAEWRRIIDGSPATTAFGFIAAEAELARTAR